MAMIEIGDVYEGDMDRYYRVLSTEECRKFQNDNGIEIPPSGNLYRLCVRDIQGDTIIYDSYGVYLDGRVELIKSSRNPNGELKTTPRIELEGEIVIGKLVKE